MKILLKDLSEFFDWELSCKIKGLDIYCLNEGADPEDYEDFTMEEYLKLIGREKDIKYFKRGNYGK